MMLYFSSWLQGAWIAAELWSVLRSVPVPKRLSNEPWAEVSRLVDTFPVSWRSYLFWHGRLKSKERVVPLQTNRDILLIPTDLEQRGNKDTVAVISNGRHSELRSSSETWLRIFLSLKCFLWMSWSLVLFFSVSHNRWQVGTWIKRLYGNFVRRWTWQALNALPASLELILNGKKKSLVKIFVIYSSSSVSLLCIVLKTLCHFKREQTWLQCVKQMKARVFAEVRRQQN